MSRGVDNEAVDSPRGVDRSWLSAGHRSQMRRFGVDGPCLNRQPGVKLQVWLNLSVTSDFSL